MWVVQPASKCLSGRFWDIHWFNDPNDDGPVFEHRMINLIHM